jgi:hypothetical protein
MATAPKTMSQKRNQGRVARRWVRRDPEHNARYGRKHKTYRSWLLKQRTLEAAEADKSVCEDCASEGLTFASSPPDSELDLHHKQKAKLHPEARFEPSEAMFLCRRHHQTRTARGE